MPSIVLGFFLGGAEQRELACAGHLRHPLDLHLGDLVGVDARDADALRVHGPHDAEGVRLRLAEDLREDFDDELHRREVVVVQQDAEERRLLQPLPALGGDLLLEPVLALRHGEILRREPRAVNRDERESLFLVAVYGSRFASLSWDAWPRVASPTRASPRRTASSPSAAAPSPRCSKRRTLAASSPGRWTATRCSGSARPSAGFCFLKSCTCRAASRASGGARGSTSPSTAPSSASYAPAPAWSARTKRAPGLSPG